LIVIEEGGIVQFSFSHVDPKTGRKVGDPVHARVPLQHLDGALFAQSCELLLGQKAELVRKARSARVRKDK
jgi:hypothetical protein